MYTACGNKVFRDWVCVLALILTLAWANPINKFYECNLLGELGVKIQLMLISKAFITTILKKTLLIATLLITLINATLLVTNFT